MTNKIVFGISEDNYLGDAKFIVSVDGKPISDVLTATASHDLGQSQEFSFSGDFSSARQATVTYLNDLYAGPGKDRDLYVDSFSFDGHAQLGVSAISNSGIPNQLSANLITTGSAATYDFSQYTAGSASKHFNDVYRFFDTHTGDHFYTTSTVEAEQVKATIPFFTYEGVSWATPDKGVGTVDVFRFFDTKSGTHFYTADAGERDGIIKGGGTYRYEGVAFQAYADPAAAGTGGVTLERFFDTRTGGHHMAGNAAEAYGINHGAAGPGWVDEGAGFTVHAPVDSLLFA